MKKSVLMWGMLLGLLLACPDTSSLTGNGDGSSGGGFTGGGDGGGDGSGGVDTSGVFSVALARSVDSTTTALVAPGASAGTDEVVGLVTGTSVAKSGVPADSTKGGDTALELWAVDPDYFTADGEIKEQTAGQKFVVSWEVYAAESDETTSLKLAPPNFAADKVTMGPSKTGKPARMAVQVGKTLLDGKGVVVVLSVYPPGTTGPGGVADRLARFPLTITKALATLHGVKVSANGMGQFHTLPKRVDIDTAPIAAVDVTNLDGAAIAADEAVAHGAVRLALTTPAQDSFIVAYNNFVVTGAVDEGWTMTGTDESATICDTKVSTGGVDGDAELWVTTPVLLTPKARTDFPVAAGKNGQVTLRGRDKYGQELTIIATLDDRLA